MTEGLRIGIMGSASLGKSTTAELLSKELEIEVHREIESRLIKKLIKKGEISNKNNFSSEQSKAFQNRALKIRVYLSMRNSFISDRVAGELWVYHQMYCKSYSTLEELGIFKDRCLEIMKRYTHLFLFPYGQIPIEDDSYRNTNAVYQAQVHRGIEDMLEEFAVPYIQLEKKPFTKKERVQEILKWIRK